MILPKIRDPRFRIALAWCVGIVLIAYAFAMVVYGAK